MAAIIKQPTWIAYTPTVAATSGTFTSVSATGRYYKTGRVCTIQIQIVITTNGTAAATITATLPFTGAAFAQCMEGREIAGSGFVCGAHIPVSGTTVQLAKYDATYAGATGYTLLAGGTYETAS